jgi:hypothetical protein
VSRAVAAAALLALGCGDPQSPEERVRAVLAALEQAAEARDVAALKEHVSETYRDERGNDRRAVAALATMHFMQHQSVHLLVRTIEVAVDPPAATASVLVAMAGTPIASADALPLVRADFHRFDFELREEDGAWRIASAAWAPASAQDFR